MISSLCGTEHIIRERRPASFDWKKREKKRGKTKWEQLEQLEQLPKEGRQAGEGAPLAEAEDL